MKIKYVAAIAISSLITIGFSINLPKIANINNSIATEAQANPCAAKKNPCAAKNNPCAAKKNPCAAKNNPCAAKNNPCAAKNNPCAAKNNPCAAKNNPCAAKASKTTRNLAYYSENGVALDGQDVVSYFTQKKEVTGNKNFTYKWKGANWQFSSAANRDLFAKNPEKYAPQYGGYCAKAASDGNLATTTASAWEVRDGKLYLNYSADAQKEWLVNTPQKIVQANKNFPKILNNETLYR